MLFRLFQTQRVALKPPLKFSNTLTRKVEVFEPARKTVKMYNCGPTVYDYVHIGNLRSYIFADTIRRTLLAWEYKVDQVINITDFGHLVSDADEGEDKMSKGLRREGLDVSMENMRTLAERYTEAFVHDIEAVGVETTSIRFPRASDYIAEQIALIEQLDKKGFVYALPSGVYFDTAKFPDYGKLGNLDLAHQQAGARVDASGKRNPQDFVLWKPDQHLGWNSPYGKGFPGWHIECTAMIFKLLGEQIDIHTGGIDHIPVHHNNEIAQAEAASGKVPFVRHWMHHAFITVDENRIGKSQGNAILLQDVVERGINPLALRYLYLTAHYRSPMNFTFEALESADQALKRLQRTYLAMPEGEANEAFLKDFYAAIANDLDTPKVLALLWSNIDKLNKKTLDKVDAIIGFGLHTIKKEAIPAEVKKLTDEREEARKDKDFARSDDIRKQIESAGYTVKDTGTGPEIQKK